MQETQLKCTKARNDYLLNLAAANAAMDKYYLQDVSTLIDVGTRRPPAASRRALASAVSAAQRPMLLPVASAATWASTSPWRG